MPESLPRATIRRLPRYLRALEATSDRESISSEELAAAAFTNAAIVRRDLSMLGFSGIRGVGYDVDRLRAHIRAELGLTADVSVAVVGAGNLGRALANYGGFARRGFRVVALYDIDPEKVGEEVGGAPVKPLDELVADGRQGRIDIGIIAVPGSAAQAVAERLAEAGVRSVLNFAPTRVEVGPGVEIRQVDLATELQILSYYRSHA
ncbi:MAG TPA: redox-sensing transcriptional repressor Rex [Acidimicrobiia bacterium]